MTPQEKFTAYFVKNYPGPDTIIHDPNWHAPRIFQAAQHAMKADLDAHIGAVLEEAADLAEDGFICRSCGVTFTRSQGHTDERCEQHDANWDYAPREKIAEAIRAIRPDAMQALERVRREAAGTMAERIIYEVVEAYEHAAEERSDTDRARMARGIAASIRALIAA